MKQVRLIDGAMFDDGSIECLNFWIADDNWVYQIDSSSDLITHLKPQIEERIKLGYRHLVTRELVYGGVQVREIQWG